MSNTNTGGPAFPTYRVNMNSEVVPDEGGMTPTQRLLDAAQRLVAEADFRLGGILSNESKARDIPSTAYSQVKARHLASLRDALCAVMAEQPAEQAYPLPDDLYPGSKDWVRGTYADRVEWLHTMYESAKRLNDDMQKQVAEIAQLGMVLREQRDELLAALMVVQSQCESMADANWRKWEELASPDEFERWVKSRAAHMAVQARAVIAAYERKNGIGEKT